jgi:acetate kinase
VAGLSGIGHRVVHGGETFTEPALVDGEVLEAIRRTEPLAPLHNPANLMGIRVALELFPAVPQVAVFDTSFHQSMPPRAFRYALPEEFYRRHHLRRYGFHGTSHNYVAKMAAAHLSRRLEDLNLITLHLGNGASAAAIRGGRSVDTSMGLTPLEGLMMGTRSGDVDPALHFYLAREAAMELDDIEDLLYTKSGLLGVCGTNDMREVERLAGQGDEGAELALEMYCYRVKKYIGAYFAVLGRLDALVFTGGIGENSALVRRMSCQGLDALGITLDDYLNGSPLGGVSAIHSDGGLVPVLVVRTDEELEIARQTLLLIRGS